MSDSQISCEPRRRGGLVRRLAERDQYAVRSPGDTVRTASAAMTDESSPPQSIIETSLTSRRDQLEPSEKLTFWSSGTPPAVGGSGSQYSETSTYRAQSDSDAPVRKLEDAVEQRSGSRDKSKREVLDDLPRKRTRAATQGASAARQSPPVRPGPEPSTSPGWAHAAIPNIHPSNDP